MSSQWLPVSACRTLSGTPSLRKDAPSPPGFSTSERRADTSRLKVHCMSRIALRRPASSADPAPDDITDSGAIVCGWVGLRGGGGGKQMGEPQQTKTFTK